jgi:peptidoglycan-associated lipoprotein
MKLIRNVMILALVAILSACGGSSGTMIDDESGYGADGTDGASTSGANDDGYGSGSAYGEDQDGMSNPMGPGGALENRVVYFNYDQSDVDADARPLLVSHGEYLATNPDATVRLEGHGDERGSREYNIGLGERRAQSVKQILLLQGASMDQLNTVSYGEERPAALGSDEETWSLNRRVELVYAP